MLNFLGIGAQKAGTTWLYENLKRHPDIAFPAGKEVHFWDMRQHLGQDWYLSHFEDNARINGEITPAYSFLPVRTIEKIHALNPDIKLVYLIRNPIDRAWSAALMALKRAEMTIDEASDQWFIDHFYSKGSLARGDYKRCILNWLAVFPLEQLLIKRFETIQSDPIGLLKDCCRHIDVDPDFFASIDETSTRKKVYAGTGANLRPGLRPVLEDIYKEKMANFEHFLETLGYEALSLTS